MGTVLEVSFSMDGSQVPTASDDHTAKVRSLGPDLKVRTFQHDSAVFGASFCPKGLRIVTLSGESAWL
jgi:WD40 repeat protein